MSKPSLLFQPGVFHEDTETLDILNKYFDVTLINKEEITSYKGDMWGKAPFNFRGSLSLAKRLGRECKWANALNWAPKFRKSLLSSPYAFLDAAALLEEVTPDVEFFARPVSGDKIFSGNVYNKKSFSEELSFLYQNKNVFPEEVICMFSPPAEVRKEYRLIFVNNRYCSSSQYMDSGEIAIIAGEAPEDAIEFGKKIAAAEFFCNVFDFIIDVAETDEGFKLVEVNAFETSSFYSADLDKIYSEWSASLL